MLCEVAKQMCRPAMLYLQFLEALKPSTRELGKGSESCHFLKSMIRRARGRKIVKRPVRAGAKLVALYSALP